MSHADSPSLLVCLISNYPENVKWGTVFVVKLVKNIDDPELFFGIVAPIGANIEDAIESLRNKLISFEYKPIVIRVTDIFKPLSECIHLPISLDESPLEARYSSYIAYGDALRKHFDDDSFLASVSIDAIRKERLKVVAKENLDYPQKVAYIIRQFKRNEEVELLRSVYGRLFFQVSIYSKRSSRVDNLSRKIATSHNSADPNRFREDAERLVQKDENEISDEHGQRVGDVFHKADLIVNSDVNEPNVKSQIERFLDLIFGSNVISPTKEEYGLYTAKSASLRSLDLSRQVGAAIFSQNGEIISIGTNEVPKGSGGTYWSDDKYDDRDFKRKVDSNLKRKEEILSELFEIVELSEEKKREIEKAVKDSQFMDALEYGRIIHAEMSAVTDAARLGRSTKSSVLFCTTFPCHMCAKHIVAAGIDKVVFLEPYPKSLASGLHGDSIRIEGQSRGDYEDYPAVIFKHFHGVSPRRYRDLFERTKRKEASGALREWKFGKPRILVEIKVPSYLVLENYMVRSVLAPSLSKAGVSAEIFDISKP